jgi:hypothetical protein
LNDNSFGSLFCHFGKSGRHLVRTSGHRDRRDLNPGGLSGESNLLQERRREWIERVSQNRHTFQRGQHVSKQFDAFSGCLSRHVGETCDVSAWSRQTLHEAGADRIGNSRHDDWDGCSGLLRRQRAWRESRHDHVNRQPCQLAGQLRQSIGIPVGRTDLEGKILPLCITELAQSLP